MTILLQIAAIIVGLGFLVFIHELGHFIAAKICKVRVKTFALGFGPDIVKYNYRGTKYAIKAIPLGGFCEMAGENPEESTGGEGEYLSLPWYKKIFIAFTGPFSNYLLAVALFAAVFMSVGMQEYATTAHVGVTAQNYPAAEAGLISGDKITAINGAKIKSWNEIGESLKDKADKNVKFTIERGSYTFNVNLAVAKNPATGAGIIGISPLAKTINVGFFKAISYGATTAVTQTVKTLGYLGEKLIKQEKPDLAGPIGVMQFMAEAAKSGFVDYVLLLAIISVALGLFNLLPIPMVDGGMIVLFLVEGITRKKISPKVVGIYNLIGLTLIIGIFIFATYSDLLRLGIGKLFGK